MGSGTCRRLARTSVLKIGPLEIEKDVHSEIREKVAEILDAYEPLPLGEDVEKELEKICKRAREQ